MQRYGEQDLDEVNINQWHAGRWITNRRLLIRFNRRMTVLLFSVAAVMLHDHVHLPIVTDMAH
ncbi:hypothetical protein MKP05_20555 [Halomonas sp. EGI 63088]|uniref:Uncharacterized protein n=1 Tax=Halomonas flagellata TaxID=2920385 RepID=A0ABS9S080_9GAMM|nr:hypothetical protein [Halomonas flagellata]MCH4565492.1 hypothetical protein [Halomonas flagellata]